MTSIKHIAHVTYLLHKTLYTSVSANINASFSCNAMHAIIIHEHVQHPCYIIIYTCMPACMQTLLTSMLFSHASLKKCISGSVFVRIQRHPPNH